jgi:anti-sigma B factor antagonist
LDIAVETTGGATVVTPRGRLDLLSAADLKARLAQAVADGGKRLVVDLGEVPFVDSSGLGALIAGLKAARQVGGDLRIARPAEQARTILELTTLDRVLRPYATVEEALAGF